MNCRYRVGLHTVCKQSSGMRALKQPAARLLILKEEDGLQQQQHASLHNRSICSSLLENGAPHMAGRRAPP